MLAMLLQWLTTPSLKNVSFTFTIHLPRFGFLLFLPLSSESAHGNQKNVVLTGKLLIRLNHLSDFDAFEDSFPFCN